jgi:phage terminase small subunit
MPRPKRKIPMRRYEAAGLATAPLTIAAKRFCEEYLYDCHPGRAALRAGYKQASNGAALLRNPRVVELIANLKARRAEDARIDPVKVLQDWETARRVDYNEFVQLRIGCCRYCWGTDHLYQFTAGELRRSQQDHLAAQLKLPENRRRPFDDQGGGGFDANRAPCRGADWVDAQDNTIMQATADHTCPECHGNGHPRVVFRDTRYLSRGARYLFEGIKYSKDGTIEYRLRSRKDFDEMVGKHLGLFPIGPRPQTDPREMTDDELDLLLRSRGVTVDIEFETIEDGGGVPGPGDPGEEAPAEGRGEVSVDTER